MSPKALEPGAGRLLEAIEGFDEQTHMVGAARVDETYRLVTVHTFGKLTMQECVLDVELVHRPLTSGGKMKHGAYCRWLDHR